MLCAPPTSHQAQRRSLLCAASCAVLGATAPRARAQPGAGALLRVRGEVHKPLALGREQLLALPRKELGEKRIINDGGKEVTQTITFSGVLLRDLLDMAGLKPDRREVRKAVVLLTARDGYQTSFSWGEIYNSALGDSVLVVLRQGQDDLLDTDGLPALRSLQDLRPGPRHVRWLVTVNVLLPQEPSR